MFVAHLPAGYLIGRALERPAAGDKPRPHGGRRMLAASLVGSVLPDVDMLWFFLVDGGRVHHHRYWTHVPLFWAALAVVALLVSARWWPRFLRTVVAFFLAIASHLVLDTVVGDVQWLQPFSDRFVHLVTVERIAGAHWIWSFVLHWTFALELVLLAAAVVLLVRVGTKRQKRGTSRTADVVAYGALQPRSATAPRPVSTPSRSRSPPRSQI